MIDLELLPMWLATVTISKANAAARPKLERYQRECARVLRDHFLKRQPPKSSLEVLLAQCQALVDQERRLAAVEATAGRVEKQVAELVETRSQAAAALLAAPRSELPAPESPERAKLNQRVKAYAQAKDVPFQDIWNRLYRELYYRCQFDVKARAKAHPNKSKLDVVEMHGMLSTLFAIAGPDARGEGPDRDGAGEADRGGREAAAAGSGREARSGQGSDSFRKSY